ncbi:hypothetical protein KUM39_23745 [Streptomyces sp. J2-1]|uniref:hypothetical protein n=1 Tax=Streptomyces corallincola TaxID=2851888 RepID=UPI001C37F9E0|nr:hypothetical protein [Streptomyces corallincola]MBV2357348.1 hypothetical protein [Streptomyces corallincola]
MGLLLLPVLTGCGDTNNYSQHAGRDAKMCVNGADCQEGAQPSRSTADTAASDTAASDTANMSPSAASSSGSGAGGADSPGSADGAGTGDTAPPTDGGAPATAGAGAGAGVGGSASLRVKYLTDDGPIGGYHNNEGETATRLGDSPLPESIVFSPGVFAKDVTPLSFNVPSGMTRFRATVGLDARTLPGYVGYVSVTRRDGTTLAARTLRSGVPQSVDESLAGTDLVTIEVKILEWAPDAVNSRPHIVVGDGRFTK